MLRRMKAIAHILLILMLSQQSSATENASNCEQVLQAVPMLFSFMGSEDEVYDGWFPFLAGKETEEGHLSDSHDLEFNELLEKIFFDREMSIGDGESMHSIKMKEDESIEEIMTFLRERLLSSGGREF